MAYQRVGYSHKYVGQSGDDKPVSSSSVTIPAGSTFLEHDTGNQYVYDGYYWSITASGDQRIIDKLDELIAEIRELREFHQAVANAI